MLIHSPNVLPKELQDKMRVYIPTARFKKIDEEFPVCVRKPVIDTSYCEPRVAYINEYNRKSLLCIYGNRGGYMKHHRSSDYTGDYDEWIYFDGIKIVFYLGSKNTLVQTSVVDTMHKFSNGSRWESGIPKDGELRTDLANPKVQDFICRYLKIIGKDCFKLNFCKE